MPRSHLSSNRQLTRDPRLQNALSSFGYASDRQVSPINPQQKREISERYLTLTSQPQNLITLTPSAGQTSGALTLTQPGGTSFTISTATTIVAPVIQALDEKSDLSTGNYGAVGGESSVEVHDNLFSVDPSFKDALRMWLVAVAKNKVANHGGQQEFGTPADNQGNPVKFFIGGSYWYPVLYTSATTADRNRLQFNIKLVSEQDVKKTLGFYIRFTHDESQPTIQQKIKHIKIGVSADTESYAKQQVLNQIQHATTLPSSLEGLVTLEKFRRIGLLLTNLKQSTEADHLSMAQEYNLDHGPDPVTAQQISSMYQYIQSEYKTITRQLFRGYFPLMFQAFSGMVEQAVTNDTSLKSTARPFFLGGQQSLTFDSASLQAPLASTGDQTYPIMVTMGTHARTSYLATTFREVPTAGIAGAYGCSATTIVSGAPGKQVPVRLFGGYSVGLVLDPSKLTIPYAEFLAVGTGSIVPRTANATNSKYSNKVVATSYGGRRSRGMNIAVCERHGSTVRSFPEGSIEHIEYALKRAVYARSEKGGVTKWSRGVTPGTPMHYSEAIVLQNGDVNPCIGLVYHLGAGQQFANANSDIPYLQQTLRQKPHLCLVVYDYNLPNDIVRQLDNATALTELDRMLACAQAGQAYDTSALPIYRGYEHLPVGHIAVSSVGDKARQFIQQIGLIQTFDQAHDDSRKAMSYLWGGAESIGDYFGQTQPGNNPYDEAKQTFISKIQALPNLPDDMTSTKLSQIFNDTARALLLSQMNSHVEYQHFVSEYYALVDCLQLDSFMSTDDFAASKSLMLDFVQASIRGQVQTSLPVSTQALLKSRIWDIVKVQNAIDDSQVIAEVDKAAMIDTAIANMNPIIQQLWSLCVDVKPRVAASSSSVAAASMFLAAPATPMITIIHPPILMFSQRQQVNQGQQILYPLSGIQVDCNHPNHVQINTPDYVITLNDQLLPDQVTARVQEIANHSYINVDAQCQQIINSAIKQIDLEENLNWLMQTDSYFTPDAQGQLFWYSIGNNALEAGFSSYSQKRALANNNYQITFDFNESGQVVAYDVFDKINRHLISDDVQKQSILFDMCACINRPQDNSQLLQLVTLS